jgi:hypothetical protein
MGIPMSLPEIDAPHLAVSVFGHENITNLRHSPAVLPGVRVASLQPVGLIVPTGFATGAPGCPVETKRDIDVGTGKVIVVTGGIGNVHLETLLGIRQPNCCPNDNAVSRSLFFDWRAGGARQTEGANPQADFRDTSSFRSPLHPYRRYLALRAGGNSDRP